MEVGMYNVISDEEYATTTTTLDNVTKDTIVAILDPDALPVEGSCVYGEWMRNSWMNEWRMLHVSVGEKWMDGWMNELMILKLLGLDITIINLIIITIIIDWCMDGS